MAHAAELLIARADPAHAAPHLQEEAEHALAQRVEPSLEGQALEDPIAGVANLFDASIVFIVSMMVALFMAYGNAE